MAQTNPSDTVYKSNDLSKWFAIGSIVLLFSVIWAVLQDYDREWKKYLRQHKRIIAAMGERKLAEVESNLDDSKLAGIKSQIDQLTKEQSKLDSELANKLAAAETEVFKATQEYLFIKASLDADLFLLDVALAKRDPKAEEKKKKWKALEKQVFELKDKATLTEKARDAVLGEISKFDSKRTQLKADLLKLSAEKIRVEAIIEKNKMSLFALARNAPVVDFISPTVKIHQIILPNLKDDYFFNKVPRVDRCVTCHANADKSGFEDLPHPFKSHPKLHLMVGEDSPHPMQKVGCTVCHAGIPQSVDFSLAGHSPKDEVQRAEWEDRYGFNPPKHIPTPMVPTSMTEGKCIQCHAQEVTLKDAPTFNAGMRLVERYGCYGCHKINDHFEKLTKEKKPGPALTRVAGKLNPEWVRKFIWDPQSYRPSSLMPRFWKNHNNSDPASLERGAVEVDSITHYIFKKSGSYEPIKLASQSESSIQKGKELVGSVGCLACHAVNDFPRKNPSDPEAYGQKDERIPMFGPELNQMGSKVSASWLQSWLINPKHYWDTTSMPSMRLSESEAKDITAYLLSKRNLRFESQPAPEAKDSVRDEVVMTYLKAQMTQASASTKLASMSLEDKKMFLGEKLIGHYGCYGCHAIEGFETFPKVGAELTYEGSKDLSKFAFENVHTEHTRAGWVYTKIRTPRIWDVGKNRDFEGKTRMPQFAFNHEQANAIASIIIGSENKNVDDEAIRKVDGRLEKIISGHRQVFRNNCIGCHVIEKVGGEVLAHYPDDASMGPPNLNTEGEKVQTEWLYKFLLNPDVKIRPWLAIRMPQFLMTEKEAQSYTHYFAAVDNASYPYVTSDNKARRLSDAELKSVEGLFKQLDCLSCHAVRKPGEDLSAAAPHLANVKGRLRDPWVVRWLSAPSEIMPGTRMPSFWPRENEEDPKSAHIAVQGYFGDDAQKQMEAMRNYLYQYGGEPEMPSPRK
jgi:cbb3-type cytochrome oxidase cytochrome c subunit